MKPRCSNPGHQRPQRLLAHRSTERDGSDTPTVRLASQALQVGCPKRESPLARRAVTRGTDLSGSLEGAGGIGGLLGRSHGYSAGNWSTHNFYHADGNGNITYLVNSSQSLAAKYRYDPYGNTISSSGSLAAANTYRFSSKEIHANSGIYYYGYRFYDPNTQTWVNRDPIGELGGLNLYQAMQNSPSIRVDPNGRPIFVIWPFSGKAACTLGHALEALKQEQSQASPAWRYAHCVASCRITRDCVKTTASVAGLYKELGDLLKCVLMGPSSSACRSAFQSSYFADNQKGRNCPAEKSCEEHCQDLAGVEDAPPGPFYLPTVSPPPYGD